MNREAWNPHISTHTTANHASRLFCLIALNARVHAGDGATPCRRTSSELSTRAPRRARNVDINLFFITFLHDPLSSIFSTDKSTKANLINEKAGLRWTFGYLLPSEIPRSDLPGSIFLGQEHAPDSPCLGHDSRVGRVHRAHLGPPVHPAGTGSTQSGEGSGGVRLLQPGCSGGAPFPWVSA